MTSVLVPELPFSNDIDFSLAFIHPSKEPLLGRNYERLEFLGDALLDLLVTLALQRYYPDVCINTVKHIIISNENLKQWAQFYDFNNKIDSTITIDPNDKVSADVFEAYLGVWAQEISRGGPEIQQISFEQLFCWIKYLIWTKVKRKKSKFQVFTICKYNKNSKTVRVMLEYTQFCRRGKIVTRRNKISLGKALLKFIITLLVYRSCQDLNEYYMTHIRSNIYRSEKLQNLGETISDSVRSLLNLKNYPSKVLTSDEVYSLLGTLISENHDKAIEIVMILQCEFCFTLIDELRSVKMEKIRRNSVSAIDIFEKVAIRSEVKLVCSSELNERNILTYKASVIATDVTRSLIAESQSYIEEEAIKNVVIKAFRHPSFVQVANIEQWSLLANFYGFNNRGGLDFF